MQLGAFYPFSRNHNSIDTTSQEPYVFGPVVTAISREALLTRYQLLPFWYTEFFAVHVGGGSIFRPVWYNFPGQWDLLKDVENQFMIGKSIMVSPALEQDQRSVQVTFPQSIWFDYFTGNAVQGGTTKVMDAPLAKINVHVRAGSIIPRQEPALTTFETRANPYELLIALNASSNADGLLYLDDGESTNAISGDMYSLVSFVARGNGANRYEIASTLLNDKYRAQDAMLTRLTIYGLSQCKSIVNVQVNGATITSYQFNSDNKSLVVQGFKAAIMQPLANTFVQCN